MYDDDEEQEEGPKSSFTTYLAEGDVLFKQGEFKKALDSYNLALELKPTEKFALVARSRCHLQLGDTASALKDAETALEDDKEFIRALYQKAEALYCMGDFEHALVFYHRGNKLRPEQQEFRLGIQKAQEAIDNSIGRAAKIKLENKGDLSFFAKQDEVKKPKGYTKPKAGLNRSQQQQQANRGKNVKPSETSSKTVKQLLGELYADKEYLEKLMQDKGFVQGNNDSIISNVITAGISYLDSRTEFWRQQKPLYARKKTKPSNKAKPKPKQSNATDFVVRALEEIDQKLADGDEEGSLKQAENTLRTVKALNDKDIPNKQEVIANLHSCIGNAYLEMDNATKALESHKRDLNISKKIESKDGISRAYDNIGRCHARLGHYAEAIDSWMEKLPLSKTPLETTWLHHEIGRCYLELKNFQDALECGEKSLKSAQQANEKVWELNATVLIAQAQVKIGDLTAALESFQNAHEVAKVLDDAAACTAVAKAIDDVNERITKTDDDKGASSEEQQPDEDEKRSEHDSVDGDDVQRQSEVEHDGVTEDTKGSPRDYREHDDDEVAAGQDDDVPHEQPAASPKPTETTSDRPASTTNDRPTSDDPEGTTSNDPAETTRDDPVETTRDDPAETTRESPEPTNEDTTTKSDPVAATSNAEGTADKDTTETDNTTNKDPGESTTTTTTT